MGKIDGNTKTCEVSSGCRQCRTAVRQSRDEEEEEGFKAGPHVETQFRKKMRAYDSATTTLAPGAAHGRVQFSP